MVRGGVLFAALMLTLLDAIISTRSVGNLPGGTAVRGVRFTVPSAIISKPVRRHGSCGPFG